MSKIKSIKELLEDVYVEDVETEEEEEQLSPRLQRQKFESDIYEMLRSRAEEEIASQQVKRNRKVTSTFARDVFFLDQLDLRFKDFFRGKVVIPTYKAKKKTQTKRLLNLLLSDLHIGSDLDPREVPLKFGIEEEARRLAAIALKVSDYKTDHRDDTELNVFLMGDIIEGKLHDILAAAPRAEQIARAIYLLTQVLGFLASQFKKVNVFCNGGNHDRDAKRHPDRATGAKWDGDGTVIYYSIKMALAGNDRVTVHIPRTPYVDVPVFDKHIFATHGDTLLNVGYPGGNINTKKANTETNKINAARPKGHEFSAFLEGHVHVGATLNLESNDAVMFWNGCLVPPSPFEVSLNSLHHQTGQWLFESVPGYAVGDVRFVRVNEKHDADSTLDKVIKPWRDF